MSWLHSATRTQLEALSCMAGAATDTHAELLPLHDHLGSGRDGSETVEFTRSATASAIAGRPHKKPLARPGAV